MTETEHVVPEPQLATTVLGLILAADRILRKELESETGAALEREARLVERLIPPDSTTWPAIAISLGQVVGHRVTLIDPSGRVRGDTEFPADALPGLENHATRPEVLQALATGVGRSMRYSVSTDLNRMYVAIRGGPPGLAIVRVSATLSTIDAQIGSVEWAVLVAGIVAIAIAALLAWVGSRRFAQPLVDLTTAAQAIAAALVGRLKTGKGQHVRLSMLDAVLAFLWASDMGAQTYVGEKVSQRAAASFIDLIYETQNGFMTAAVMTNKEWAALTRALGHPEWLEDPRFTTPALRDQNIDTRLQMTQDVLKTLTTEEWLERLEAEQVPCAPVLTRDQVIAHPQIRASGILLESDHPDAGRLRQTRTAARFATPTVVRHGAPRLGQHSREVLAELGLADEEIAALRHQGIIGKAHPE